MKIKGYPNLSFSVLFTLLPILTIVLIISLKPMSANAGGPWYVTPDGNDSNSCLSVLEPCETINGAIVKASGGDTIYIEMGTYTDTGNEVVLITKDIIISGGWNDDFTNQNSISIVDGEVSRRGITVNNGLIANIERFIIQNGYDSEFGGGIYNGLGSQISLEDVDVVNNNPEGVFNDGGTLMISNCSISYNQGDGIYSFHPSESISVTMKGSVVDFNDDLGFRGFNTDLTVIRSSINENQDGGVWFMGGALTFEDVSVAGNNGSGISILNAYGSSLSGVTISGNHDSGDGGGLYYWGIPGGTITMTNVTISGNTAEGSGGGINAASGTMELYNVTLTSNTAESGGGIYNGISTTLSNSIVANNNGGNCGGVSVTSGGYNLDSGTTCGFSGTGDINNSNPLLDPLADNGGPTKTRALQDSSPAIDAGNPSGCIGPSEIILVHDQRGFWRTIDGDNNESAICDIGAYEYGSWEPLHIYLPWVAK